jgi:hypothetical protein
MAVYFYVFNELAHEEKTFNPDCLNVLLLEHIKQSCGYEHLLEPIDLATETGEVLELQAKRREYAKKTLELRGVYVLVKHVDGKGPFTQLGRRRRWRRWLSSFT